MKQTGRFIGFVLIGLAATTVTGVICQVRRHRLLKSLLTDAANDGYEVAYDIKYPNVRGLRQKQKDLKYGPVIPKIAE